MKFTDDNKQVKEMGDYNGFSFGVHKVTIGQIELGETDSGKEYVEVTVMGENGEEDTARVWFTTDKAANYSFNILRQIYVHNAPEKDKDAARDTMDAVKDTEELVAKLNEKLVGGECWFTKYYDPQRSYLDASGNTRRSVNKNIYGYEPKPRPELMQDSENPHLNTTVLEGEDVTGTDAAKGIPKAW